MPLSYLDPMTVAEAAIDFDNYMNSRSKDMESIRQVAECLKEYQLKGDDMPGMYQMMRFYWPLINAMRESSCKNIDSVQATALEMRLLRYELENPRAESADSLISFLCAFSRELSRAYDEMNPRRLAG